MALTAQQILEHHQEMHGKLHLRHFKSRVLGIRKPWYIYQTADWSPTKPFLLIWLFRGHEREWVNFREDTSRVESTAIQDLDALNLRKIVPPAIAIMPGLTSTNNWVPSGGVNMVGDLKPTMKGLGSGRFWDYLTCELMPFVESTYNPHGMATKAGFGFSLGDSPFSF
jgi:enterochelin esterase-like enzyme